MAVPTFIANHFSEIGIKKLFAAVRKQVKDLKYQASNHEPSARKTTREYADLGSAQAATGTPSAPPR